MYAHKFGVLLITVVLALAPGSVAHASAPQPQGEAPPADTATRTSAADDTRAAPRWRCGKPHGSFQVQRCVKFLGTDWNDVAKVYPVYLRNRQRKRGNFYCEATESRTAHWTVGTMLEVEADFVLAKAKASISAEFGKSRTLSIGYGSREVSVPARSYKVCRFGVARPTLQVKLRTTWREPGQSSQRRIKRTKMRLPTGPYVEVSPARPL
jgi:hypothetical protein